MEIDKAIFSRQMVSKVAPERPSLSQVEHLLSAAVAAPNHHLTEPWRFIVLTGAALDHLGSVMGESFRRRNEGASGLDRLVELERERPKRAPVIITVVYVPSTHPKAIEREDRYAVGAAVENMLLAAHGEGLGAFWRTGPAAEDPEVAAYLGLSNGEEVAGFVYVGIPLKQDRAPRRSREFLGKTEWRGWDSMADRP